MYYIFIVPLGILGIRTSDQHIQVCRVCYLLLQLKGLHQGRATGYSLGKVMESRQLEKSKDHPDL